MEQEQISLYPILFNIIVLLLNIWVQRGSITVFSRLARSFSVGVVVIIIFLITSYIIDGTYHSLILIAVITLLLNAMGIGLFVWLGYAIFGSSKQNHTLEEVAKQYDVTRKRIKEIEKKALRRKSLDKNDGPDDAA